MPVDRASIPDQVFRALVEAVLSGRFAPGEKLPAQRSLAKEYGVNMASVREAIKRLEQLRLVDVRHGESMRVRDWRSAGLDVLALAVLGADGGEFEQALLAPLMEARKLLLAEAARLAASRRTEEEADLLERLAAEIDEAGDEDRVHVQGLDFAFMATLIGASRNVVFVLIMNSIRELYFARQAAFEAMIEPAADRADYARAAHAIRSRDADAAAATIHALAGRHEERLSTP